MSNKNNSRFDIAGAFARNFIHSPMTPLFLLAFLVTGIIGILITPRQEDPQISVPMVDIFVAYPGASNRQVEALVAEPLERLMHEIKGVKHVYSASQRGMGLVTVEFDVGENMEDSLVKLYNKLASNMDKIPPGVQQPLVKPKGPDDVPVVTFTLSSKTLDQSQLRLLALDVLQSLSKVDDVAQGFVVGGEPQEIRIDIDPARLASYDIPLSQIGQTIRAANSELEAGRLEAFQHTYKVYTGDFLKTVSDIQNLVVGIHENKPVYVRDIAHVYEGHGDISNIVLRYTGPAYTGAHAAADGEPAVTIALAKKPLSNGVTVAEQAIEKLQQLKGTLIPDTVYVQISRDYGKTANDKVNELVFKLFIATAAVAVLVWFFLGWRASLVTVIVIPVVILSTVFAAWLMDFTIDRVSLFALIFSIGILVDDAVVVLENIYRRWLLEGKTLTKTSIEAVSEVGNPTIIATLTVIAALAPMGFVSGMMGPYMAPIPALGSVAMIISLFAAFAFTPWLAQRIRPTMQSLKKAEKREHAQNEKIAAFFRTLINSLLINKAKGWGFLAAIVIGFFLAIMLVATKAVPVKLLPYDNKPDFSITINFPEGTALPVTANLTHQLVQILQDKVPEIRTMESYAGTAAPFDFNGLVRHYYLRQNPWQGDIQVHLIDKSERARSSHEIAEDVRQLLAPVAKRAGARIQVVEMPPGPPVLQSIVAEVYAPSDTLRDQITAKLTGIFESVPIIGDVDNFLTAPHDTWRFVINKQKAMEKGISVQTINQTVSMAMGEYKIGDVKEGFVREPTYITLQVPLEARAEFARLGQIPVPSSQGFTVPLAELGHFVLERQQNVIYHKDLTPVQYVTGTGVGRLGAPIYGMLAVQEAVEKTSDPLLKETTFNFVFPPDALKETGILWSGEWTVTYETFRDMGLAFAVALLVIYMLVVWEFKNFLVPLIVMAPIPLTLIGIAPGHWLLGAEFTATSMIGFIALAGIIVRNSILLVDFSRQAIDQGTPVVDAVIMACKTRTRPILITALALVLGSSVILFDPIFQGMAISLMFGTLVATLLTLVVIPLGCVSARSIFSPNVENEEDTCQTQCSTPTAPSSTVAAEPMASTRDKPDQPERSSTEAPSAHPRQQKKPRRKRGIQLKTLKENDHDNNDSNH
ncbi:MAG TPA: efflux RND transporter permease subunit [Piscirickettsiaceae bacterium]|nr:efflux RND transporter permease subunit [Piscirickettsiaceae bacterium]